MATPFNSRFKKHVLKASVYNHGSIVWATCFFCPIFMIQTLQHSDVSVVNIENLQPQWHCWATPSNSRWSSLHQSSRKHVKTGRCNCRSITWCCGNLKHQLTNAPIQKDLMFLAISYLSMKMFHFKLESHCQIKLGHLIHVPIVLIVGVFTERHREGHEYLLDFTCISCIILQITASVIV